MNPLLSLSFLSSGPVATGAEPVANEVDSALDESGGANKFGRLLNQSGEQQHMADRQSFAGVNVANKSKRLASMEGQPSGRPEISLPPVLPPEAELNLAQEHNQAEDSKAGALLGLLDLASQTRLQLTAQAGDKAASTGSADSKDVTNINDGKKLSKGAWFILPVYPELAKTGAGDSEAAAGDAATGNSEADPDKLVSDQSAAVRLGKEAAASLGEESEQPANQSKLVADNASQNSPEKSQNNSNISTGQAGHVDPEQQASALASNKKMAADPDIAAASKQATPTDNPKVPATAQTPVQAGAEPSAELLSGASDTKVNPELMAAQKPLKKSATETDLSQTAKVAQVFEQTTLTGSNQPLAGATIFDKLGQATTATDDGTPGSSLASAAAVADSAQAKQQQRAGMADSVNQTRQALAAANEAGDNNSKMGADFVPSGQRAEASLSGFGSVFSQAGQSQAGQGGAEAVATRLDATIVAGAQQSVDRAKAQSVNKSVTEQLKQVNLLAQNAAGQLKERINLMVRQNIQVAEIRLDPADLGQMQIRVNLQQEQASVQFIVQQQHAKELLEQQMPRLREMLQQQGIQLGEGQVQQQRQGDSQASGQRNGNSGAGQGSGEQHAEEQATAVQLDVKLSERLVDYYA